MDGFILQYNRVVPRFVNCCVITGLEVTEEVKQQLLELLCVYKCQDPVDYLFGEERITNIGTEETDKFMLGWVI